MKRLLLKFVNAVKLVVILGVGFAGMTAGGYLAVVIAMGADKLWLLLLVPVLAGFTAIYATKFASWLLRYKPVDPPFRGYSGGAAPPHRHYADYRPTVPAAPKPEFKPYVPPQPAPYVPQVRNPSTGLVINPHTGYDASGMQYGQFPKRF